MFNFFFSPVDRSSHPNIIIILEAIYRQHLQTAMIYIMLDVGDEKRSRDIHEN